MTKMDAPSLDERPKVSIAVDEVVGEVSNGRAKAGALKEGI